MDVGLALPRAFDHGYLDVPYCLQPDNAKRTRSYIDPGGRLRWSAIGSMPLGDIVELPASPRMTSADLLTALSLVERRFDARSLEAAPASPTPPVHDGRRRPLTPGPRNEGR